VHSSQNPVHQQARVVASDSVNHACHNRRRPPQTIAVIITVLLASALWRSGSASVELLVYEDPKGRFTFTYPPGFGAPSRGANDGFADRAAAIRFAAFSSEGVGGELVVTQGPPTLDLQAAGGLHDAIAREALPERWRQAVIAALPRLTAANVCRALAAATHLDPAAPALAPIPPPQRVALENLDRLGNVDPVVDTCAARNGVTVFRKSARITAGAPRRSLDGVVRFLDGPYSSVQIVRGAAAAPAARLEEMRLVLESWRAGTRHD
jgi:hypothetical protein